MRRNIQIFGWTLIWSGVFLFGYLGWQLFGTDVVNSQVQAQAETEVEEVFEAVRDEPPVVEEIVPEPEPDGTRAPALQYYPETAPAEDEAFAVLIVPKFELETVVFEGVTRETLKKGPGHMPGTALPGQPGNAVVSGHRTTHGRPFWDFGELVVGDMIQVETAIGIHTYEVRETFVVEPTDVWVADDRDGAWLTLTTCEPKFSARQRLIISAELVRGPNLDYVDYVGRF